MQPPIADPIEVPQNRFASADTRAFRFKFWPYFVATTLTTLVFVGPILGAILFPVFARRPEKFPLAMAAALFGTSILIFALCALLWSVTRLRINRWGLRSFSLWGVPREVQWGQIERVQFRWVTLPYAVIWTSSDQKLWVLLSLQNERACGEAVAQVTPTTHPLHALLAQRGWMDS